MLGIKSALLLLLIFMSYPSASDAQQLKTEGAYSNTALGNARSVLDSARLNVNKKTGIINYTDTIKLLESSAQQGVPEAMRELGIIFFYGPKEIFNASKAEKLFKSASALGDIVSNFHLGIISLLGKKDEGAAINYFNEVRSKYRQNVFIRRKITKCLILHMKEALLLAKAGKKYNKFSDGCAVNTSNSPFKFSFKGQYPLPYSDEKFYLLAYIHSLKFIADYKFIKYVALKKQFSSSGRLKKADNLLAGKLRFEAMNMYDVIYGFTGKKDVIKAISPIKDKVWSRRQTLKADFYGNMNRVMASKGIRTGSRMTNKEVMIVLTGIVAIGVAISAILPKNTGNSPYTSYKHQPSYIGTFSNNPGVDMAIYNAVGLSSSPF